MIFLLASLSVAEYSLLQKVLRNMNVIFHLRPSLQENLIVKVAISEDSEA